MRINPNLLDTIVTALSANQKNQNNALLELSSGRRINAPSDDPAGAAAVIQDSFQKSADTQFTTNNAALQGQLQVADSTLSSVISALTRVITLGTQGANGTLSDSNRQALAQEVSTIKDQLTGLANVQFQGNYIFGGTNTRVPAFVADGTAPGGVRYDGNGNVNTVEISLGQFTPTSVPGSKIFRGAGADVFQAVDDLSKALQSGTGIEAATAQARASFDYVNTQRSFYGATLSRLNSTQQFLASEQLQLDQHETTISGADLAQASAALLQAQNAQQALVGAAGRVNQGGLIDVLR